MFQRCIDIKEPLISIIAIIRHNENVSSDDFCIMEHYCSIFKPFIEATVELSTEKGISVSKIIILCNVLMSYVKNKKEEVNLLCNIYSVLLNMENKMEKKFNC